MLKRLWLLVLIFACFRPAHADVALLLEEPYGAFGGMNPTGHAAECRAASPAKAIAAYSTIIPCGRLQSP